MERTPPRDRTDEVPTFDRDLQGALSGGRFLTDDVTQSDLAKYPLHQLEARLIQYERDYTFERNPKLRAEFKGEVDRTRVEINRRKMYATREAERVFEL
jgi:hypothetical protein